MKNLAKFSFKGGIHIHGAKSKKNLTTNSTITPYLSPKKVHLPLSQNLGKPPVTELKVGDEVKKGQKIAEGDGVFSANLHASISGTVVGIEDLQEPRGVYSKTIVIENDFKNETIEKKILSKEELKNLTKEEIVNIIKEAGIVGLGGAASYTCKVYGR